MSEIDFYHSIQPFSDFGQITQEKHFKSLPDDWFIVITDVKGSTEAIAQGRYKEVNTVGAASIVSARKGMDGMDYPFVFGGDGATIIIPGSHRERVLNQLCALRIMALTNYQLDLRVGVVSMQEIKSNNAQVLIAKHEITPGRSIAVLRGNGIDMAEKLIKAERVKYEAVSTKEMQTDLKGLSCRWQPIPSSRGNILTLLISARSKSDLTYGKILKLLESILPEGLEAHNPMNQQLGSYNPLGKNLQHESRLFQTKYSFSYLYRCFEIVVSHLIFKQRLLPLPSIKKYNKSMRSHSDFRKFDNTLRMVLDCSVDQSNSIKKILHEMFEAGEVFYGTFETSHSLMTCFVDGLDQSQHIHFMDADNGGYAMAAIELKRQMKSCS